MSVISDDILNIVKQIFGTEYRKHNQSKNQISFDCPNCDDNKHKGNLEINYGKLIMKCWKCSDEPDGLKGSLRKLIKNYGTKRDIQLYDSITEDYRPEFKKLTFSDNYKSNIKLPKEYVHMGSPKPDNYQYHKALNYLLKRGLNIEDINKYDIGYCETGEYGGRIIVPSYDKDGDLNYFVARSYVGHRIPYKNPEINKQEVIINHLSINWDSTVYIVEGIFDMMGMGLDNTIPLLGKYLHPKLFHEIVYNAKANIIICLDPDAKKNAYIIYRQLDNVPELRGRIRVIDLPPNVNINDEIILLDIAKIKELYGHRGVLKCLKRTRKLTLQDYIENGLY